MNITLRKANALQNSIRETIHSIKLNFVLELNEFQNPSIELTKTNDELFKNDSRRQKLLLALYNIRGLVAAANAQTGIDLNLTKSAFIDKRIAQLEEFTVQNTVLSLDVINGKLEKIKSRKDDGSRVYIREEIVTTSVLSQSQIDQVRTEIISLKKQKQKLNDEILDLNIRTEIPLSADVVQTLQSEFLI